MQLVVISDLHIGSGSLDDCDTELESAIVEFVATLEHTPAPTELIINGDFLDFAQAVPWKGSELESETADGVFLCFTEEQSLEKLEGIVAAHTAVFMALHRFLSGNPGHKLVILPGNHDVDFFWESVRRRFTEVISQQKEDVANRLRFHLHQVYQPDGFPGVWIEHGHQYDECNRFYTDGRAQWSKEVPPILKARDGILRLVECVGSRFLIKFLNDLDADYPFVDNVKPFSKFVKMFLASSVNPGFGPLRALTAYWAFTKFLAQAIFKTPKDLLSSDPRQPYSASLFAKRLSKLPANDAIRLASRLVDEGFDFQGMPWRFYLTDDARAEALLDHVCQHPNILDETWAEDSGYLNPGESGYLTLGAGYLKDETRELQLAAQTIIGKKSALVVIMGHTHEAVNLTGSMNYVNIGSWTRCYSEGTRDKTRTSWELLKPEASAHFPYELGFAQVLCDPMLRVTRELFRT